MSWAVQAWVEKLDYRSIDIPNSRKPHHQRKGETDEAFRERRQTAAVAAEDTSATATRSCHASSAPSVSERTKRLTFAHREVLKVIADHARQNGLAWPGMDLIAKEAHISYRQAFNIVPDLELAGLVKIHKTVGGAGHSNHYWVRVPWVEEPDCVLDLPKLTNEQLPPGVRRQRDDRGNFKLGPKGNPLIDVEYYVSVARLKTLKPVTRFISETEVPLKPVTSFEPETLKPVSGEPSSLRESSSLFEPLSLARAARKQVEENDEDERETANAQPTLPRFGVLSVPGEEPAPVPQTKPCPDCGCPVTVEGAGHRGGADRCRAYGRSADVERCLSCPEWIDKRQPLKWHSIRCPIRRQLLEDSAAGTQVDQIADGVAINRGVAPRSAADSALAEDLQRKLEQVRATENGEHVEEAAPARPSRRRRERVAV